MISANLNLEADLQTLDCQWLFQILSQRAFRAVQFATTIAGHLVQRPMGLLAFLGAIARLEAEPAFRHLRFCLEAVVT